MFAYVGFRFYLVFFECMSILLILIRQECVGITLPADYQVIRIEYRQDLNVFPEQVFILYEFEKRPGDIY